MMSKKTIATPPGATIREQLEDREMTQKEFARRMDMSEKHISKLINGEVQLTPDVALRLEHVLGIPASFWNNLEATYREKCARVQEENDMETDAELAKSFPYAEMAKLGWVKPTRDAVEKAINLRNYFQVAKLGALNNLVMPGIAYRRVGGNDQTDYALAAWSQQARIRARDMDVKSVNVAKLQESIPAIRSMTLEEPAAFCEKLMDVMAQCGVALVFLPHMNGSFLHGATFFDGKKIVMGLTVRGKDADRFWFSLMHEIGHVVKGHLGQVDDTTEENEREADAFAAETLIPSQMLKPYVEAGVFTEASVKDFARHVGIAPGIVVGRLQKDNVIRFNQMNNLKERYMIN